MRVLHFQRLDSNTGHKVKACLQYLLWTCQTCHDSTSIQTDTHLPARHILVATGLDYHLIQVATRHLRSVQDLHSASTPTFDHSLPQQVVVPAPGTALHTRQALLSSNAYIHPWMEVVRVMEEAVVLLKDLDLFPRGVAVDSQGQTAYLRWRLLMNTGGIRRAQTLATLHL